MNVSAISAIDNRSLDKLLHHLGNNGATLPQLVQVDDAVRKALAAGIPWLQILFTILPFVLSIFTGGTIDIPGLIAAILALLNPPAPAPTPAK